MNQCVDYIPRLAIGRTFRKCLNWVKVLRNYCFVNVQVWVYCVIRIFFCLNMLISFSICGYVEKI